ncbi:phosphate ABC transporter substrate-binding protein [Ktedonospora formicarum]|uniref:Phosphate-binding protein n=1 Tax=Ktedonospora formicarum TaxID=2778364 RepID=A0A8J3I2A1_9CHLR|nr:phosphate ABC transporter substrate-binding protein [Ktedonospora formicarum]GHO44164.1 phosphate-binding protein [Ktedonospora formicarum]
MLKKWRVALVLLAIVALSMLISACGGDTGDASNTNTSATQTPVEGTGQLNCVSGTITASGSTALQPYVDQVAKKYQAKCSGAKISVLPGGSKKGLSDAENGTSQIGNSDVFADTTQGDLVDHQVAIVIFTMIVSPDVTAKDLTTANLIDIYTGKITNWKEVGGADEPIVVVSRPTSSGTRATFKKFVLDNKNESPAKSTNLTEDSTGTVVQTIQQTKGAIGYAALSASQTAADAGKVKILTIDGKEANADNVKTNAYKFWNIEHMYTKGEAKDLAKAFLDYMFSDDANQAAESLKFVKIKDVPQDILTTHAK